jgi:hypothetical protein
MVRSCAVIPENFGGALTFENCSRGMDIRREKSRIGDEKFEVFGSASLSQRDYYGRVGFND